MLAFKLKLKHQTFNNRFVSTENLRFLSRTNLNTKPLCCIDGFNIGYSITYENNSLLKFLDKVTSTYDHVLGMKDGRMQDNTTKT
jgi:hypothetical protein